MSGRIEVGDLVVVVRWPCCGQHLGMHRTVRRITTAHTLGHTAQCESCGHTYRVPSDELIAILDPGASLVVWLKRIPPLSELESTERKEEVTA